MNMDKIVDLIEEEFKDRVSEGSTYNGQTFRERIEAWVNHAIEQIEEEFLL